MKKFNTFIAVMVSNKYTVFCGKLQGYALFYALVFSLIVLTVCSMLLMYLYLSNKELAIYEIQNQLIDNAKSGMVILQTDTSDLFSGDRIIDLFDEGMDSVYLEKKRWGLFEVAVSKAFRKKYEFTQIALLGNKCDSASHTALYLSDQNKPLALCGNTLIKGNCYLPEAGVKRAYIEGKNYKGDRLIYGNVKKSSNKLPKINEQFIDHNLQFLNKNVEEIEGVEIAKWKEIPDSVFHSFKEKPVCYVDDGPISIFDNILDANIIVVSYEKIFIGTDAKLKDILVYAPSIEIEKGFKGTVQLFASDSIKIAERCTLDYPSVVCLLDDIENLNKPYAEIGSNSLISGVVMLPPSKAALNESNLLLDKDATVYGQVYVDGIFAMNGNVTGNVTCRKFMLKTASSVYENHLLDVKIDNEGLSEYFAGGVWNKVAGSKEIITFLQ